jgi:imidazolonepropionase-like amidohydrolase
MKIKFTLACLALLSASVSFALPPAPAAPQSVPVAITGATVHIGNGEVLEAATVTFAEGIITGVYGSDESPDLDGHEIMAREGEHLYPGFILPNTRVGLREVNAVRASLDDREEGLINASVRTLTSFNTDSELLPTYRFNGVLTAQVTPTGSLIAGNSSIMQMDAWNWQDAAIKANDALHIYWPSLVKRKVDALRQRVHYEQNESYEERVEVIRALFAEARQPQVTNLNMLAVKRVLSGQRQLFIHAEHAKQLADAVQFIREFDIPKPVLVGAREALKVKELILAADIPVLVQFVHGLPAFPERSIDESYERAAKFAEAGFTLGLASKVRQEPSSGRNLPFMAGTAAAYGLGKEAAVSLITLGNAKLLGIDDKLGSIEVGKYATLFTSKGDALEMMSNQLTSAFIQGRKVQIEGMQQELFERFQEKYAGTD